MMEKMYQLVAYTKNIADKENARLYMIPSLESEVKNLLFDDLRKIHHEEYQYDGHISTDLARRAVRACRNMSRFEILCGHLGDGVRYLFFAAAYCIWEDDDNWADYDTDLGSYSYFCGKLRHEFENLCEEALALVKKHDLEHILMEEKPKRMLEIYFGQNQWERDLERHQQEMSPWL